MDDSTAKKTTPVETAKQKPSKGRKKKQLQAGRGDQHITSFFRNVHKPLEQSQTSQTDMAWKDVSVCSRSMACKDDQISMRCNRGNSEKSYKAGNVSEAMMDQSNHTHNAGKLMSLQAKKFRMQAIGHSLIFMFNI